MSRFRKDPDPRFWRLNRSIELWLTCSKPRSAATDSRSISQLTPARAPEPSGITLALSSANWKRSTSRASIQK